MAKGWQRRLSKFKTIIKKNGLGGSKAKIQEFVSSFNNATRLVTGAGSASECLLGCKPRFFLPMASNQLPEGEREEMIQRVKANRDSLANKRKYTNIEGRRV